jgi:hypothetical protein
VTTTPVLPVGEAAELAATREQLERECAHIAELRMELRRCEDDVRRLSNRAYWQLAQMWEHEAAEH